MTATLEQMQSDLLRLVNVVQQGEEIVITSQGHAVAKLSAVPQSTPSPDRPAWLARLAELRVQCIRAAQPSRRAGWGLAGWAG